MNPNGYNIFYFDNGIKRSEGTLRDGNPDGYWKTYYENGVLKSEGNRSNFLLDSTWIFYDEKGNPAIEIAYQEGKKHGNTRKYDPLGVLQETYKNEVKHGPAYYFDTLMRKIKEMKFENGLLEGKAYEYDTTGMIIGISEYKSGALLFLEYINRYDKNGFKHGRWKEFWDNGKLKSDVSYYHGKLDGFFKDYDAQGNLQTISKYENGKELENVPEIDKPKVKTNYYPSGRIKIIGTYRNEIADGIRTEFKEDGTVEKTYIFNLGALIAEGLIDNEGLRQGEWKDMYPSGKLKAEGVYKNGKRTGIWKFYHENGQLEQQGLYLEGGISQGKWVWYHENGQMHREEIFERGKEEGLLREYDDSGKVLTEGTYIDGLEEGQWIIDIGDYREEGMFQNGEKTGVWKAYFKTTDRPAFEGEFIDGSPEGKHVYYYDNRQIRIIGKYAAGRKEGDWTMYNQDGTIFLIITYKDGVEIKYNGVVIKPEFAPDDFETLY
ncbi:MAG: hypothetical protein KKD31_04985 [Bacteroidetes bacterium]|nr:hypothetical protein [Bacteroidota bacterium]